MTTIDIYENIKNPLENLSLMRNLFTAYLKTNNFDDFYDYIRIMSETKNLTLENDKLGEAAYKKFLLFLFNIWRKSVLNTSLENVSVNKYGNLNEYLNLKDLLKYMIDIEITNTECSESNFLRWYKKDIDYTYITSYYIDVAQQDEITKEHVLYININSKSALFRIIESFIIQCIKYNLPYNFKYSNNINNDSTFVVFSDTKLLVPYTTILKNICNDNELNITMSTPKILSGVIDKYIGYESYIYDDIDRFTMERLKIIYDVLKVEIPKLYDTRFKKDICDYKDVTFNDYIFDELLKSKERVLDRNAKGIFSYAKLKRKINEIKNINFNDLEDTNIKIGINDKLIIERNEIMNLYINLLNTLFRKYPKYINKIILKIKEISKKYQLDEYTFCFDYETINKLSRYEYGENIIKIETIEDSGIAKVLK